MTRRTGSSASGAGQKVRPRGRPTDTATLERENDLLLAAVAMFEQHGFSGSSITELARLTGISKTTIYARYRDKEALFRAICSYACRVPADCFRSVMVDDRPVVEVLTDFALAARQSLFSADATGFLRLAMFEAGRFPEIAATILSESRDCYRPLTGYLAKLASTGQLREGLIDDPVQLADRFIALTSGSYHRFLDSRLSEDDEIAELRLSVDLFWTGIAKQKGPA